MRPVLMLYTVLIILKMSDSSLLDVVIDLHSYSSYNAHNELALTPLPTPILPPNVLAPNVLAPNVEIWGAALLDVL
jgi:hypothetical protein